MMRALPMSARERSFLRNDSVETTAEQIFKEASFSRGALHPTCEDKERLFMEVLLSCHHRHQAIFASLPRRFSGRVLLEKFRGALADMLKDPECRLIVDLELEALHNDKLRERYVALVQQMVDSARSILDDVSDSVNIQFALEPDECVSALINFIRGVTANQTLLGSAVLPKTTSRDTAFAVFNCCLDPASLRTALKRQRILYSAALAEHAITGNTGSA